jgi:hypothetical protein
MSERSFLRQAPPPSLPGSPPPAAGPWRVTTPSERVVALLCSDLYEGALSPAHRAVLEARGITPEASRVHKIMSVPITFLAPLLGLSESRARRVAGAILFPSREPVTGEWRPVARVRLCPPLLDARGHTVEFVETGQPLPRLARLPRPATPCAAARAERELVPGRGWRGGERMMTTATATAVREFFAALFADARGVIELRAFPSKARRFAPLSQFDTLRDFLAAHAPDEDVYVGVAARRDATSGTLANCATLSAGFTDIDFKTTPEAEARRRLAAFPFPRSILVHSGHGLHAYWLLREPIDLSCDTARARALLQRLAAAFGGDPSAAEPARVLRIPGTWNHKDDPAAPVTLERCEPESRYNLGELEEWLPVSEAPAASGRFEVAREPVGPGSRSGYLFRAARSLKMRGFSETSVRALCLEENRARCVPPLEDAKVTEQVRSAFAQADRPGFEPRSDGAVNGTSSADAAAEAPSPADRWPTLAPEALYGLPGQVVAAIDPHTEADPVATLLTFLVAAGNLLGAGPHAQAGEDRHPGRLYAALVGESSKGRKGMSWRAVRRLLAMVDTTWTRTRIASGLSSGEGVIFHVRDPREEQQAIKERGRLVGYETIVVDHGVEDKRLLVEEPELASVLRRMDRESNSLSAVLRQAWDDGDLGTLTKNSPLRATGAHVSLLAHVTRAELVANLGATERVNGFANRFLYAVVRRSKELPDPAPIPLAVLRPLAEELAEVVAWAQTVDHVTRAPEAGAAWGAIYSTLSAERSGLLGAITNRAEACVDRLVTLQGSREQPVQFQDIKAIMGALSRDFPPTRILIESWQGAAVVQELARDGWPVELVTPTARTVADQWNTLSQALVSRRLVLPVHAKLREELLNLTVEIGPAGPKVIDRGQVHQDHAVVVRMLTAALALPARPEPRLIALG